MDYNKLVEYRAKIRDIMDQMLADNEFELSIKYLTTIHETLFKGILYNSGHFRHFNISREEEILNLNSVDYPDYHTVATYLRFFFRDQSKIDYRSMNQEELIKNISKFISELWVIHPFSDGNTRTTGLFTEMFLKQLGYNVNHDVFKENTKYFRDALVRANYKNEDLGIEPSYDALINFYSKVLIDKDILLNEEYLYIPELFSKNVGKSKRRIK